MSLNTVKQRIIDRARELANRIEADDMPDLVISLMAANLLTSLSAEYPKLWEEVGRNLQRHMRQSHGLCSQCGDNEIACVLSHPPICNDCERANDDEMTKVNEYDV